MSDLKNPCSTKIFLLKEYVASLNLHNKDVREHAEFVKEGVDGDLLAMVKKRMAESMDRVRDHRQRYTNHVHEHGCESQPGSAETE